MCLHGHAAGVTERPGLLLPLELLLPGGYTMEALPPWLSSWLSSTAPQGVMSEKLVRMLVVLASSVVISLEVHP
eukprot:SM005109S17830  [mRNA]  locus=s5109:566:914:- [translate_table: standard]